MQTKLTLNITDKGLIDKAKAFAKSQNKSLSVLLENILRNMVAEEANASPGLSKTETSKILGAFKIKGKMAEPSPDAKWDYLKDKYQLE